MFWMLLSGCLSVEAFEGMTNNSFPHQPNFYYYFFLFSFFSFLLEPAISSGVWDDSSMT